jgi:hypothetical protein
MAGSSRGNPDVMRDKSLRFSYMQELSDANLTEF